MPLFAAPLLLLLYQAASSASLASLPPLEAGAVRVLLVRHGQSLSNREPHRRSGAAEAPLWCECVGWRRRSVAN